MPDDRTLVAEFEVFAHHFGARRVDERLTAAYVRAHSSLPAQPSDPFDAWLYEWARRGTFRCALADCYSRRARPFGLLRRKLVLALAVLESMPATHASYDTALASSPLVAWASLIALGVRWGAMTTVSVLVLLPVQLLRSGGSASVAERHG